MGCGGTLRRISKYYSLMERNSKGVILKMCRDSLGSCMTLQKIRRQSRAKKRGENSEKVFRIIRDVRVYAEKNSRRERGRDHRREE